VRSVLSIILLSSFLIVNLSKSIILVNYEMNKAEITAKYCINKDKPQMHCCGKCLLKKKLAEEEEQQKLPAYPDIKTDIQLYCSESFTFLNSNGNTQIDLIPTTHILHTLFEGKSVFHPPGC
jgi:predicted membrane protein